MFYLDFFIYSDLPQFDQYTDVTNVTANLES